MNCEILHIPVEEVYENADRYMAVICGFNREGTAAEKSKKAAMKVRTSYFDNTCMDLLLGTFGPEAVFADKFVIDGVELECTKLSKIDKDSIVGGYTFLFHAPMPDLSTLPISKMYLADSWQTAFVDAGRDNIREMLHKKAEADFGRKLYITDTIAPGMFGIQGTKTGKFFEFMDASLIDVELLPSGLMKPVKSFVGIFLLMDREAVINTMNCGECLSGGKQREYCKNFAAFQ